MHHFEFLTAESQSSDRMKQDAVAYRVKQLEPTLELEKFSNATSML